MERTFDFTRTFHPVGQGAFYSERFKVNENFDFLTIYDCGTDLQYRKLGTEAEILCGLESRIDQDLGPINPSTGKHEVQLLFISHFDEDHVSGIHTLNPRIVVMPLLTEDEITCYELLDFLQVIKVNWNLLRNPRRFFGHRTAVIGIEPDYEEGASPEPNGYVDIDEEGGIRNVHRNPSSFSSTPHASNVDLTVPTGTSIRLRDYWHYIVFNPKLSKLNEFKNALTAAGWNWNTLADDLKSNLSRDKVKELRNIYKNISPDGKFDLNSTSLLVYSGPTEKFLSILRPKTIKYIHCGHCRHRVFPNPYRYSYIGDRRMACMYFGDWMINGRKLEKYYRHPLLNVDLIGTIQIPHHGSRYNNGHYPLKYLTRPDETISVISHGEKNRHRHPSSKTIADILKYKSYILHVTDNDSSAFINQWQLICQF